MSGYNPGPTVGALLGATVDSPFAPVTLTRLVWALFVMSVAVLFARLRLGGTCEVPGVVAVDGLAVLLWVVVTFFSGIVHGYSRRYMAGSVHETKFSVAVLGFMVAVMALVAVNSVALFWLCWLAMELLMAKLTSIIDGWPQVRAAASVAHRYFLASSVFLGIALAALWWSTGATTVSGIAASANGLGGPVWLLACVTLVLAAMIQSAFVPFHSWLLSSMTTPTSVSVLIYAGFVNVDGILLFRFTPVVTLDATLMLDIVTVGTISALLGKLLRNVQSDVKNELDCSTIGQMGFMIMQVGLGFFGAAITHLVLHGFYKAYHFLSAGGAVEWTAPPDHEDHETGTIGSAVIMATGLAGGVLFAALTGKGTHLDSGLLLVAFVMLTTLHAARNVVARATFPAAARYGTVPLVFLPVIAVYALVYQGISNVLSGLPTVKAPVELSALHTPVAGVFLVTYVAIELGVHERSRRLYITLLNTSQPASSTTPIATEDYNEY